MTTPDPLEQAEMFTCWVRIGVLHGWVSLPVCATHRGTPTSEEEDEAMEQGYDPCIHVLRLWPDGPPESESDVDTVD